MADPGKDYRGYEDLGQGESAVTAVPAGADGLVYARRKSDGAMLRVTPQEFSETKDLTPVTSTEAEDYDRTERVRKAFEGPVMGYAASGIAGARAASMGGLDLAATSLLPPKYADAYRGAMQALEAGHPGASFVGAGVGTILPFAIPGGGAAGALGRAAPVVMTDAVGTLAKEGVKRALGEGALGTGAGWAAKMGLEAGLWNTANNAALARMRDQPITADKLWSGNPGAIMFGGALGLFGGGIAGGIGAVGRRAAGARVMQETGADMINLGMHGDDAAHGITPQLDDALGRRTIESFEAPTKTHEMASAASGGKIDPDTLALGQRSAQTRQAISQPDVAMARVGDSMSGSLNSLDEVATVYQMAGGGRNKLRQNARLFDGDANQAYHAADTKLDELTMDLRSLTDEHGIGHILDKGKYRKAGETLPDYITGARERMTAARIDAARRVDDGALEIAMTRRQVAQDAVEQATRANDPALLSVAQRDMAAAAAYMDSTLDDLITRAPAHVKRQLAAETISEFEEVKRLIGSIAKDKTAPTSWQGIKQKFRREADPGTQGSMAESLGNPRFVGDKLAAVNRRVNRLVYESIHADNPIKGLKQSTGRPDPDFPWADDFKQHSSEGLKNTLGTMTAPTHTKTLEHFRQYAETNKLLAREMLENYDLTPGEITKLKGANKAGDALLRDLDPGIAHNALQTLKVVNQVKARGSGSNPAYRIWGSMLGGMVGGPLGAPLGFLAGSKMASALNPLETTHIMAGIERIYGDSSRWQTRWARKILGFKNLDSGADKVMEVVTPPVKTGSPRTGKLAKAGKMTRALLYEAFREDGDTDDEAYAKHLNVLKTMSKRPELVEYGIRQQMGEVGDLMPNTVQSLTGKSLQAAAAILAMAPSADKNPTDMPWNSMPPSEREKREVEEAYEALLDPHSALEGFMEGKASPQVIDLLDQVIPHEMEQMRTVLTTTMQQMARPPKRATRVKLSILMRKPIDISMTAEYQMSVQQVHDARAAVKQEQKANYRNRRSYGSDGVHNNTSADKREAGEYPK